MKKLMLLLMAAAIAAELLSRRDAQEEPASKRNPGPGCRPVFAAKERDGKVFLSDVKGAGKTVTVPDRIDGKEVAGIGRGAFMELKGLDEVILPDQAGYIDTGAFTECPRLRKVVPGKGLKRIGRCAFDCCPALTLLDLPEGVQSLQGPMMVGDCGLQVLTVPGMETRLEDFGSFKGLIRTPEGSAAYVYAKEHGLSVEAMSKEPASNN